MVSCFFSALAASYVWPAVAQKLELGLALCCSLATLHYFYLYDRNPADLRPTLTREQLTESVLGRKLGPFDRVIDVHVSNLRRKLGPAPGGERIKSVRGSGYVFVARSETK